MDGREEIRNELLLDDFELPNSDRSINIIKESDDDPLAVKNARLFLNDTVVITKIGSSVSAYSSDRSISILKVRSQLSPNLIKIPREHSKRIANTLLLKHRKNAVSPSILKKSNHNRESSQKKVSFNMDSAENVYMRRQLLKKKKVTMKDLLRQF